MGTQDMDTQTPRHRDYGFVLGMLTGTFVGAGLAVWLAPRLAAELRQRVTDAARSVGDRAAEHYRQASVRVADVADELVKRGNGMRDDVASAVAHGAHEVERVALAAKSDRH